jgi:glucose/arabinose dehydrogenase
VHDLATDDGQDRFWVPSIAISGLSFYTGDKLAAWKGNAFVGRARNGN